MDPVRRPLLSNAIAAAALALLVVAVYWPGLQGGFVFDDFPNIVDNVAVHVDTLKIDAWMSAILSSPASMLRRPIAMFTFAINHYFTGLDPVAMKATNIAIHVVNAWLIAGLLRALFALCAVNGRTVPHARALAWGIAAAWALNPVNLMGVLYIVQRMESLSHLFVFVGLWLYFVGRLRQLRGERGHWQIGIGLLGGTALGLLCKESGVLLPLYAWLAEMCLPLLRQAPDRRRMQALFAAVLWLPFVAGMAWLAPRVLRPNAYANRDFTLVDRLLTEPRVLFDYIEWTLAPRLNEFALYHDDYVVSHGWWSPPTTAFAIAGLLLLAIGAWWCRTRRPIAALGVLWFLAAQALTATVIPLELVYEHRNYFASLGLLMALADLLVLWPAQYGMQRIGALVAALACLYYAGMTHLRAREWSEPLRYAQIEAAKHPTSPRATYGYGRMLVIASNYDPNSQYLQPAIDALEQARSLPRSGVLPHSALLLVAAHTRRPIPDAWWDDMTARLRKGPIGPQEVNSIQTLVRCARNGECRYPTQRIVAVFEAALARRQMADLYTMYGDYTFNVLDRQEHGIALARRAVEVQPAVAQYRINLAQYLIHVGRIDEAREQIAAIRAMGSLGQNEAAALKLESRIEARAASGAAARPLSPRPPAG